MNFIEKATFITIGIISIFLINNKEEKVDFIGESKALFSLEGKEKTHNSIYIERPVFVKNLVYQEETTLNLNYKSD